MKPLEHLAIVGSGPSAIYLLKHLLDAADVMVGSLGEISIFEKCPVAGMGMPYNPLTTDRYNLSNIASEELPELTMTLADWLRSQDAQTLEELGLGGVTISEEEIYSRLTLGRYLHSQYQALIGGLEERGIRVHQFPGCAVQDLQDNPEDKEVTVITSDGASRTFSRVIIATGHCWPAEDRPEAGFYASPWPISKLLPASGEYYNFPVGTLGASLSAFDVLTSLAHRHGEFVECGDGFEFRPFPGAEDFKIVMHSAHGLLPHLQYDQEEPFREIYRHITREGILELVNPDGFLRLADYFDHVCRPVLIEAFQKDDIPGMVASLLDPKFDISQFVEKMSDKHDYENAFEGMRREMVEAKRSVIEHLPIHWKETADDLIYTLNYHAELLPAEDFRLLQSKVMPFLMNVIAALPLPSGHTILALYDAGKLDMVSGLVTIPEEQANPSVTRIDVNDEGDESSITYQMFVDCSGQKPLELDDYPFPTLVAEGAVRNARVPFATASGVKALKEEVEDRVFDEDGVPYFEIGGIDIDGTQQVIGKNGDANPRIRDISFPHTTGVRPYSYGLQACSDTSEIVVCAWVSEITAGQAVDGSAEEITQIYDDVSDAIAS